MQKLNAKLYTAAQVRGLDNAAIHQFGIPGYELMCRAGQAIVDVARAHYPASSHWLILCGPGNNGGDGYVVARLAAAKGISVRACSLANPQNLKGDAATACREWHDAGGETLLWPLSDSGTCDLVFDALLGTGIERQVQGVYRQAIDFINAFDGPVVAIDIPSGLNADSGVVMGAAVGAQRSVSFVGRKRGMYTADGPDHCGQISFDNLGIPAEVFAGVTAERSTKATADVAAGVSDEMTVGELLAPSYLAEVLTPRLQNSHKGSYGQVLAIGGGKGMSGAIRLCGEAALRSGAGKVRLATDPEHAAWINLTRPELMVSAVASAEELSELTRDQRVLALGPGLGKSSWSRSLVQAALGLGASRSAPPGSTLAMVIDADALNIMAEADSAQPSEHPGQWVLTPHPAEAARLLGVTSKIVQNDRVGHAQALANKYAATVVLKGCGTVIADKAGSYAICPFGNPGMATAGSGDVLTGMIAALLAQGLSLPQAARAGVLAHALAGDAAASKKGELALIAGDIIDCLPAIWQLADQQQD